MEKLKVIVTAVWSIILSALGILAIPVLLLVTCNLIDYFTGIAASKFRKQQIDSYKGIRGIAKKICMWLLVGVGVIVDQLLFLFCRCYWNNIAIYIFSGLCCGNMADL